MSDDRKAAGKTRKVLGRRGRVVCHLSSDICHLPLAGLVAIAGGPNPIPFRTRPLNSPAPMILSPKAWESRSLPGLPSADESNVLRETFSSTFRESAALRGGVFVFVVPDALLWSSVNRVTEANRGIEFYGLKAKTARRAC